MKRKTETGGGKKTLSSQHQHTYSEESESKKQINWNKKAEGENRAMAIEMVERETGNEVGSKPRIMVVGIGGAGVNAIDNMVANGLDNVSYLAINTDAQALAVSSCERKLLIGVNVTKHLGTGANPFLGEQAALEDRERIKEELMGSDLVFITAGLGGGTGTGASPVVADVAKEVGALTVAITTKPFDFEGPQRRIHADAGQTELRKRVETLITIPNERLLKIVDEKVPIMEAFKVADSVLTQCVRSISDLITEPGNINLDFADIKTIMDTSGGAVMGVGFGQGEDRTRNAFAQACSSPLMEEVVIEGATGILVHLTAGPDITLYDINTCMHEFINSKSGTDANIIFGMAIRPDMKEQVKVTILAAGFNQEPRGRKEVAAARQARPEPQPARRQANFDDPAYLRKEVMNQNRPVVEERPVKVARESVPAATTKESRIPAIFGFK